MPYRRSPAPGASARAAASSNSLPPASVTATRRLELEEITPLSVAAYVEQLGTAADWKNDISGRCGPTRRETDSPCAAENTVDQNLPEEDRLVSKPSLNPKAKRKF